MMGKKNKENVDAKEVVDVEEVDTEVVEELSIEESLKIENEALLKEIEQLKNDKVKAYADADNTIKRIQREGDQKSKYSLQSFASNILPALDNLERALLTEDATGLKEGVEMVYNQIMEALKKEGVEPIIAVGQPFDANIHQAMMVEVIEDVEPGIVVQELQKGYMIKDRVLRASLVKVSE